MNAPQQTPPPENFFRGKKREENKETTRQRNTKAVILFLVSAAYGLFTFFIIQLTARHGTQGFSILALYIYGLIGGLGFLLLKQIYTDADRSRKILTEVLEKSAEARVITNPDGETIYSNQRFNKLSDTGENPSLLSFCQVFDDPAKVERALNELRMRTFPSGSATIEFQTRARDKILWYQVTCQHITGWPGYIHWRFDDISHRYHMEAAIREEREKLRDFTDNAPVGFFSVDAGGKFLFANDTLIKLLGTNREALIRKKTLHDFLAAAPAGANAYDCFAGGGAHQHGELEMKTLDGRVFKADVTHSLAKGEDGEVISRSIVYDLTSEQKMQEALRQSEDRFQRLFEEAPVGICMLSAQAVISDTNQRLAALLHAPASAINGKNILHFISDKDRKRAEDWLKRLSQSGPAARFLEVSLKGKQGQDVVVQLYARKFSAGESLVLHFIDLTEQKNLEKQFTQSQKMQAVGQLAGGIAHDFNNLLTAMIGFCDLLLLRHKPGDPSFSDIMQVKQNANRAANMVRQLLAFSRQQTLQPRVLDLTDVLTELSHLLRRLIGSNIELNIAHGSELGLIKADQGQMEQVLINLVVNARDAMPQGGKIILQTANFVVGAAGHRLSTDEILPPGEWISIAITDTGTGIDADVLPHIFEPFFSTKEVGAGTGLGLATVHGIIHQTGGFISVGTEVGKGTTFTIYLPRHKEVAGEKVGAPVEEKPVIHDLTGSSKILLVEDEDAVRTFSTRALSNKGHQVVDAPSGTVALRLLEEKKIDPDLLITDVMMPEMDGTALAKIVREKYPRVKIIFISGYAEDRFKEHLGENVWFLPKPFTLKQLATKVKEVMEG